MEKAEKVFKLTAKQLHISHYRLEYKFIQITFCSIVFLLWWFGEVFVPHAS